MSRRCVILAMLAAAPAIGLCASPQEKLVDDELVVRARKDVQMMPYRELEAFISYLASCDGFRGEPARDFACGRDRNIYVMKFGTGRPLDQIIELLASTEQRVKADSMNARLGAKERKATGETMLRMINVKTKLRDAANLRSRELLRY